jgi:hypothetical protein
MKIKSLAISAFSLLGLAGISFAGSAMMSSKGPVMTPAPDEDLGFEVGIGYDSKYVFRGVDFGDHSVWGSIDYSAPLTDNLDLGLGLWYETVAETGNSFEELDVISGLTYSLGAVDLGVGLIWYYFPDNDSDALELGTSIGTSVGPVDLGGAASYDFEVDGWYFEVSAESTIELTDSISLVPGALVSYGQDYYGVSGFNNAGVSLALPIALTKSATLTPYVAGSFALDALEALGEDDHFYGGVSLSVSF